MDESGKTLAVLAEEIPFSKTQISTYLGGRVPAEQFVTSLVRATAPSHLRERRHRNAASLLYEAQHPPRPATRQVASQALSVREALESQAEQLETYRRLTRALEQVADLRQAADDSVRLIWVLLSMIQRLHERVAALDRGRDALQDTEDRRVLETSQHKLARAREQHHRAEAELARAEERRRQAEELTVRLREQIVQLTDDLDRLRGDGPSPHDDLKMPAVLAGTGPHPGSDAEADDIDAALAKASAVNNTGTDTINRISTAVTGAARVPHPDVIADNPATSTNTTYAAPGKHRGETDDLQDGAKVETPSSDGPFTSADLATEHPDIPIGHQDGGYATKASHETPGVTRGARFEARYREYLVQQHADLSIFGVDLAQQRHARWSLDLAYLSLEMADVMTGPAERAEQALAGRQRTVVMGDAGSGKTTLLQWLAINAARGSLPNLLDHLNGSVPFILPLRRLANEASFPRPADLLAAVSCPLASEQPDGWARRVFEHGRALVLVDGVDEIALDDRARAREWLETMLSCYPRGCYVVTTRVSAVPEGWLANVGFRHLMLRPMSVHDVESSIALWHAAARFEADDEELQNLSRLEEALQSVVRHDPNLTALATSPLLCSVLCALNRDRHGLLPQSVMSLYEAALSMLLVRRDAERGIGAAGVRISERQSVQLLQALAYWLIRNGHSQTDPTTAVRLLGPVLAAMPTAPGDAAQVLRLLLERCGVLREPAPDRLEFIHRTFQDFLGARAAIEAEDISLLVANAHEDQWRNVVKMAIGHARPRECAQMVQALVARGDHEEPHRKQLYALAASCVEYATELAPEVLTIVQQRRRDQEL